MVAKNKPTSKAQFRVLRERIGYSQYHLARLLNVDERSVKYWENPRYAYPPEAAWQILEEGLEAHLQAVDTVIDAVEKQAREAGHLPRFVDMLYYRTQAQYDKYGRDKGDYLVVDARAREIAIRLEEQGVEARFHYPEDSRDLYTTLAGTRYVLKKAENHE